MKGLEASKQNKYLVIIPDNNMLKYNHNEKIIEKELKALETLISLVDIKVDLRPSNQDSFITIGDQIFTISYDKAELLEILNK